MRTPAGGMRREIWNRTRSAISLRKHKTVIVMKKILFILPVILLVASCQPGSMSTEDPEINQEPIDKPVDDPALPELDCNTGFDIPSTAPALSDSERGIGAALNDFGIDVLSQILKEKAGESFMFSPLSLSLALSMCLEGAGGDTRAQLAALLGLEGKSKEEIETFFRKTIGRMMTLDEKVSFRSANGIWYDVDFPMKESYLSSLGINFDASTFKMDFDAQQILIDAINKWVSEKTSGTIKGLLQEAPKKPLALANTLYFKGGWAAWFADKTINQMFYGATGSAVTDFFHGRDMFDYAEMDGYQVLLIPYGNPEAAERFEMAIVLPEEGISVQQTLSWISESGDALIDSMKACDKTLVLAQIPCFEIESTLSSLQDILSAKYHLPFTTESDFSGISDKPLYISQILQKTFISVDQKGTEASAATYIEIAYSTGENNEPEPILFRADRPFVFLIRDNGSGCNIFVGVKQ